jgi:hypothetical protein
MFLFKKEFIVLKRIFIAWETSSNRKIDIWKSIMNKQIGWGDFKIKDFYVEI